MFVEQVIKLKWNRVMRIQMFDIFFLSFENAKKHIDNNYSFTIRVFEKYKNLYSTLSLIIYTTHAIITNFSLFQMNSYLILTVWILTLQTTSRLSKMLWRFLIIKLVWWLLLYYVIIILLFTHQSVCLHS